MNLKKQGILARLMNAEPDAGGTDVAELDDQQPGETENGLQPEEKTEATEEVKPEGSAEPDDSGELVVTIGDAEPEEPEEHAPGWVRDLRKQYRELQRENRELKAKAAPAAPDVPVVGKKPTLEDHDYDTDAFESALVNWHEQKRKAEEHAQKQQQALQAQQKEWEGRLQSYAQAKESLKVRDFEDAEALAQETFSVTQQGIVLHGADNPALMVYALGKNPAKAKELAAITDPVKFAFAVARLEKDLKTTTRKPSVAPEKTVTATARVSGAVDDRLTTLKAKAEKSGDYSEYLAYKRSKQK